MEFFKKVGRPSQEEQMMIDVIAEIIHEKGIETSDIPECHSLEDLIEVEQLVRNYRTNDEQVQQPEHSDPIESSSPEVNNHNIEEVEEDHKEVELSIVNNEDDEQPPAEEIQSGIDPEEILEGEPETVISSDYDPFADPIIERSYNQSKESQTVQEPENTGADPMTFDENLEEAASTPLDDLNPNTKRKAAEQSADAILKGYAKLAPEPFKWLCKFPESKIEKMSFKGELDTSIEVEEGVPFSVYMKQMNQGIEEIFEVQEETIEEIREPLVEVLMEQKMELTPQQRLGMAVVSHLIQMFTMAVKLWGQNKRILEYQKHLTQVMSQARPAA